jgi:hypothetical protein
MGQCLLDNEVKKYPTPACEIGLKLKSKYGVHIKLNVCGQCPNYKTGDVRVVLLGDRYNSGNKWRGKHFLAIKEELK